MTNTQDPNYKGIKAIREEIRKRAEEMPLLKSSRQILSGSKDPDESISIEFTTEGIKSIDEFKKISTQEINIHSNDNI